MRAVSVTRSDPTYTPGMGEALQHGVVVAGVYIWIGKCYCGIRLGQVGFSFAGVIIIRVDVVAACYDDPVPVWAPLCEQQQLG